MIQSSIPGVKTRVVDVKINKVELKKVKAVKPPTMSVLKGLNRVPSHFFYFKNYRRIICCSYNTIRLVNYPNLEELDGTNEWII
jgi:hypothetical protein